MLNIKGLFLGAGAFLLVTTTTSLTTAQAATLEEQAKSLEGSVQTVEQRRKVALKDLNVNVLQAYRDAIKIESVDTDIAEAFEKTARVRVVVGYSVDFDAARNVRSTLSKYFVTNIDKADGVEPLHQTLTLTNGVPLAMANLSTPDGGKDLSVTITATIEE